MPVRPAPALSAPRDLVSRITPGRRPPPSHVVMGVPPTVREYQDFERAGLELPHEAAAILAGQAPPPQDDVRFEISIGMNDNCSSSDNAKTRNVQQSRNGMLIRSRSVILTVF
ncbi:hypothetical protein NDU88_007831 [Pleurodeles waltl]|uniref:Uncharacterized protein n=1 Tax=Pleurodeles waltl TaxID=8319 RepID=A0AAV7RUC7_PLEWA|nr:hypothetical protein NDU88_007831 [Pleurodeles waltl]